MAKYTVLVKSICENFYLAQNPQQKQQLNFTPVTLMNGIWDNPFDTTYKSPLDPSRSLPGYETIIDSTLLDIFPFSFPIYDPASKQVVPSIQNGVMNAKAKDLCTKIIKHYYMREIGFETIELWKMKLDEKLNLIMPFYNQLYASEELNKDNPLENHNLVDSSTRNTTSDSTSESTETGSSNTNQRMVVQDTPSSNLGDEDYASGITDTINNISSTGNDKNTANGNVEDVYNRNVHGLSNYSKQDMLERYRQNMMNIDENIVRDLYDLFMLVID